MNAAAGTREEMRCPSCARLLVLRTGPAVRPHFAHRPRQSCRKTGRPGTAAVRPLRLEQLALFELEPLGPRSWPVEVRAMDPEPIPALYWAPVEEESRLAPAEARARRKRRRKAWFPRLVRWVKARATRGDRD